MALIPVWIAEIDVLDENNQAKTLYYSDGAYIDDNWNYYEPRMEQPALVQTSPNDGGTFHIFSEPSVGEISLINNDGELNFLADYAVDNGNLRLSLIDKDGMKIPYLTGKIAGKHEDSKNIYLAVRSMSEVLARPHPNKKYLGNNVLPDGVEGVATDIKGNIKSRVYGSPKNVTPILVNTARLIYQFSDRNSCVINAVYDKGSALTPGVRFDFANFSTFQTTTVTAGTFNQCGGFIKLGALPSGVVTGDPSDGTGLAGDVFEQIINELTFTPTITFNTASKAILNSAGKIGILVTSETSTASLLNQIVASIVAAWYFIGDVIYANFVALATTSVFDLTDAEIIDIERTGTGLGSNGIPISAVSMQYGKIETVQSQTELAGSLLVSPERISVLANQYRSSFIFDSAVLSRHPLAESITITSLFCNESDAITAGTRALNLAKNRVDIVKIIAVVDEIPEIRPFFGFTAYTSDLGYDDGKLLTVSAIEVDAERNMLTIGCFG